MSKCSEAKPFALAYWIFKEHELSKGAQHSALKTSTYSSIAMTVNTELQPASGFSKKENDIRSLKRYKWAQNYVNVNTAFYFSTICIACESLFC